MTLCLINTYNFVSTKTLFKDHRPDPVVWMSIYISHGLYLGALLLWSTDEEEEDEEEEESSSPSLDEASSHSPFSGAGDAVLQTERTGQPKLTSMLHS